MFSIDSQEDKKSRSAFQNDPKSLEKEDFGQFSEFRLLDWLVYLKIQYNNAPNRTQSFVWKNSASLIKVVDH